MPSERQSRWFAAGACLGIGVLGTAAGLLSVTANPAGAAALFSAVQAVTCATTLTTPCLTGSNASSGNGVRGVSTTGTGLRGSSTTNFGLKATSNGGDGILGESTSGDAGVLGTSAKTGVYGYTTGNGIGVWGSAGGTSGFGVAAFVTSGIALGAYSNSGIGLRATTTTGTAVLAFSHTAAGLRAETLSPDASKAAVVAQAARVALQGTTLSSGFPLTLRSGDNTIFSVDGVGDMVHAGRLVNFGPAAHGANPTAVTPAMTVPAIEDTGTARLVSGAAAVRLDPTFAATIDVAGGYRVLLSPRADTRGLFVAMTAADGFIVRESQGGRTNVSFDYRIVATPVGGAGRRMAITRGLAVPPVLPSEVNANANR